MNPLAAYKPGQPITPADWALIASGGSWQCLPHLDLINRRLVGMARERYYGRASNLLIMCPPQHGKTTLVSHAFPAWWLGNFPDDNVLLVGYQDDFAAKRGRVARDAFTANAPKVFGLEQDPEIAAASDWGVKGRHGSMTTAGAGGPIAGVPVNLLVIDDPIKSEEQAYSETFREGQWEWFTGTLMSRIREITSMVLIMTPWHEDDLGQRIVKASLAGELEHWDLLRIPALAESQEDRDDYCERMGMPMGMPDPVGRKDGEALWPRMWPVSRLEMRRKSNAYQFEAMYQGRPRPKGGSIFKGEWFNRCRASDVPVDAQRCRFWDKAGSQGKGDWSASVLMAKSRDGHYFIEHVTRDRLSAFARDQKILAVSEDDANRRMNVRIACDQDPAQAGKSDAEHFRMMLDKYEVKTIPVSGDPTLRARPFASAVEGQNVWLVEAPWNKDYIDELESFNKGKHDDQVQASAGAYNQLAASYSPAAPRSALVRPPYKPAVGY